MGAIIRRRQLINNTTLLYAYGAEAPSTGGWIVAGYNQSSYHPIGYFTKGARSLNYTQTTGGGSREEWYKRGWATTNKVTITGQKNLCVTFANDFTIPRAGNAYPSMVGIALVSTLTDTNTGQELSGKIVSQIYNWGTEIKAGKVYKLDVSSVSGDAFVTVYYGVYMAEAPYQANISKIWLEAKGETQGTVIPEDFDDHGVLPIMPDKGTLKTVGPDDIVSFPDGNGSIFEQFKASIEPLQDLHGYANPWPAGGGKNKYPLADLATIKAANTGGTWTNNKFVTANITFTVNEDGTIGVSGTASTNCSIALVSTIDLEANTPYRLTGCPITSGAAQVILRDSENTWLIQNTHTNGSTYTPEAAVTANIICRVSSGTTINGVFKPMLSLDTSLNYADFAPYANICPISGWTGAEGRVTGRNLLDIGSSLSDWWFTSQNGTRIGNTEVSITAVASGTVDPATGSITITSYNTSGYRWGAKELFLKKNTDYKILVTGFKVCGFNSLEANTDGDTLLTNAGTFNTGDYEHIVISFYPDNFSKSGIMVLMDGDTDTSYSPYNGTTYPIDWTDEAGTVYGGYVDFVTGELVATHKLLTMSGTYNWAYSSATKTFYAEFADTSIKKANYTVAFSGKSEQFAPAGDNQDFSIGNFVGYYITNASGIRFSVPHLNGDIPSFKTLIDGEKVVYPLATPQTYQLDPVAVRSILGVNNCWTDTGETELKYYGI